MDKTKNYLKITHNQNSQSNSNIIISKHGHLSLNIQPAKRFRSVTAASPLNTRTSVIYHSLTRSPLCHFQLFHTRSHYSKRWCCFYTPCLGLSALGLHAHRPQTCPSSCCTRGAWEAEPHRERGRTILPQPSAPCLSRWQTGTAVEMFKPFYISFIVSFLYRFTKQRDRKNDVDLERYASLKSLEICFNFF